MDEFKEQIAALNEEIGNLHGLVAGLAAEIDTLRRACLAGLAAARDRAPDTIDSIVEIICADLAEHAHAHASDDDDKWREDLHNVTATELEAALRNIMPRHPSPVVDCPSCNGATCWRRGQGLQDDAHVGSDTCCRSKPSRRQSRPSGPPCGNTLRAQR